MHLLVLQWAQTHVYPWLSMHVHCAFTRPPLQGLLYEGTCHTEFSILNSVLFRSVICLNCSHYPFHPKKKQSTSSRVALDITTQTSAATAAENFNAVWPQIGFYPPGHKFSKLPFRNPSSVSRPLRELLISELSLEIIYPKGIHEDPGVEKTHVRRPQTECHLDQPGAKTSALLPL